MNYEYFYIALKFEADRQNKPQKVLAIDSKVSESYVSNVFKRKKQASLEVQERLAGGLGYCLIDFLILGRSLVEGKKYYLSEAPTQYTVKPNLKLIPEVTQVEKRKEQTTSREGILELFENRDLARKIILDLSEIEKRNPMKLEKIEAYVQSTLEDLPSKKTANG